jgi:MFS family permease
MFARLKTHPYALLAHSRNFRLFWLAQLISPLGDRLNQVALVVMVYASSGSPFLTAATFATTFLPNLILGPIAGVFVDRFPRIRVMVTSDLIRAGLVLSIPLIINFSIILVLPIVFIVATAGAFFKPARSALVLDVVEKDQLTPANSACWVADVLSDFIGYPLAGVLVVVLGPLIGLIFILDCLSYLASAFLLLRLRLTNLPPKVAKTQNRILTDLRQGWQALRHNPSMFDNTILCALGEIGIGMMLALGLVYAHELPNWGLGYPANYAIIQTTISVGLLCSTLIAGHFKGFSGRRILGGFALMGASFIAYGLANNIVLAVITAFGCGLTNMLWLVPTQTMALERVDRDLLGRVLSIRTAVIFGTMSLGMFMGGILSDFINAGLIIAAAGVLTLVVTALGTLRPALRNP